MNYINLSNPIISQTRNGSIESSIGETPESQQPEERQEQQAQERQQGQAPRVERNQVNNDAEREDDWLGTLHNLVSFFILLSIVYYYSSLERFLLIFIIAIVLIW